MRFFLIISILFISLSINCYANKNTNKKKINKSSINKNKKENKNHLKKKSSKNNYKSKIIEEYNSKIKQTRYIYLTYKYSS